MECWFWAKWDSQWSYCSLFLNMVLQLIAWLTEFSATEPAAVINTLRPRQNGRRFADDTFKRIFLNENVRISIKISLKFVSNGPINNNPALVQIMAWRRPGDKPLSEPMMATLLTHICVTRPQWVKFNDFNSHPGTCMRMLLCILLNVTV